MSLMHYIAANKKLPLGEFRDKKIQPRVKDIKAIRFVNVEITEGSIPLEKIIDLPHILEEDVQVFRSIEDAAGIYICDFELGRINLKNHFRSQFVYSLSPNFGNFYLTKELKNSQPQKYKENRKCIYELIEYIHQNIDENEEIELYTCWSGDENNERKYDLDRLINLNGFNVDDDFGLIEGQYLTFIKSYNIRD